MKDVALLPLFLGTLAVLALDIDRPPADPDAAPPLAASSGWRASHSCGSGLCPASAAAR
jgi:hypothetical protein